MAYSKLANQRKRQSQYGLGLTELMVSVAISIALMMVVVQVYAGSRQAYRATTELSELQEQGQLALDMIGYNIRMAGWLPVVQYDTEMARDADEQFIAYSGGKPPIEGCIGGGLNCAAAVTSGTDALTLRHVGDVYNSQTGAGVDCLGQNPYDAVTNPNRIAQNRFFLNTRTITVNGV